MLPMLYGIVGFGNLVIAIVAMALFSDWPMIVSGVFLSLVQTAQGVFWVLQSYAMKKPKMVRIWMDILWIINWATIYSGYWVLVVLIVLFGLLRAVISSDEPGLSAANAVGAILMLLLIGGDAFVQFYFKKCNKQWRDAVVNKFNLGKHRIWGKKASDKKASKKAPAKKTGTKAPPAKTEEKKDKKDKKGTAPPAKKEKKTKSPKEETPPKKGEKKTTKPATKPAKTTTKPKTTPKKEKTKTGPGKKDQPAPPGKKDKAPPKKDREEEEEEEDDKPKSKTKTNPEPKE